MCPKPVENREQVGFHQQQTSVKTAPPKVAPTAPPHIEKIGRTGIKPAGESEEGWGAWLYQKVVQAGTMIAETVYFAGVKFNVRDIRKKSEQNFASMNARFGYAHFGKVVESFLPLVQDKVFQSINQNEALREVIETEEENIREVTKAAIVQVVRNWVDKAAAENPDSDDLARDMFKLVLDKAADHIPRIQERLAAHGSLKHIDPAKRESILEPLVQDLNAVFLPNGRADIPAPYPINQMIYSAVQDMLYSEDILQLLMLYNTGAAKKTLEASETGQVLIEQIAALKTGFPRSLMPDKSAITELLADSMQSSDALKPILTAWLGNRYENFVKSDGFDSLNDGILAIGESVALNLAAALVKKEKENPQLTQDVAVKIIQAATKLFHEKNRGGNPASRAANFKRISTSLLSSIGIQKKDLPVPDSMRDMVWEQLTLQVIPNLLEMSYGKFLNREFLENQLINQLKAPPGEELPAVDQNVLLEGATGDLVFELAEFFDLPFMKQFGKEMIGNAVGDIAARQLASYPFSKMLADTLRAANAPAGSEEAPAYDPDELPRVLGERIKADLRSNVKGAFKGRWDNIQKVFDNAIAKYLGTHALKAKHGLDQIFRAAAIVVWYALFFLPSILIMAAVDRYIQHKVDHGVDKARESFEQGDITKILGDATGIREFYGAPPAA